ncbi:MAG: tetratricopeptide repeat protein [Polyangiaceae bacterium]|nr:tetratricopeptide repeat protein [Polyangiaceae bacterium]
MGPLVPAASSLGASEAAAKVAAQAFGSRPAPATDPGSQARSLRNAEDVVALCLAQLERRPEKTREARLHFELGRLYESPLGDAAKAAEHYMRARTAVADHRPTLSGARRVLIILKQYQQALPLFDEEIRLAPDQRERAVLLYQKGQLLEDQMGQKREAREAYQAAAALAAMDATFLKAVERSEAQAEAWDALDKTLESLASAVSEDIRYRAALIAERARLVETKKGDPVRATELYRAAFQLDPRAPGALEALKRLHYAQAQFLDLAQVLEEEVRQLKRAEDRALSLLQLAELHASRFGNHEAAENALMRAHKETPEDTHILERLASLFERHERHEDLVWALERLESLASGPEEHVILLERIGRICEKELGQGDRAVAYYLRALSYNPGYRPALTALGCLYESKQKWLPLIDMLQKEAEVILDPLRRAACYARVGEVFEVELGDAGRAVEYHARALVIVPGYESSFKALVRLYSVAGKYRDLVELYEGAVESAKDNEGRITYLFKIGRIHEDALGEPAQAVFAYQRILALDAKMVAAMHAIQRAAERGGRFKDLVKGLIDEVAEVQEKSIKVQLLHRAAEVTERKLEDDDAALALYRTIAELDPGYLPALVTQGELLLRLGRFADLVEVYRAELKVTPKGPKAATVLHRIAEVLERLPNRQTEAVASYRSAVEMDPFNQAAHRSLRRKLYELAQWPELVRLLELELSATKEPEERARVCANLGEIFENRLARADKALAAYEQALQADPGCGSANDGRRRLLAQAQDRKRLVEVLESEAETALDPALGIAARLKLAEVFRDELKDPRRAVAAFERVLAAEPDHVGALLGLEGLYTELAEWEGLAVVQAALARVAKDPGTRLASLRELARTQETKFLVGVESARDSLLEILAQDPSDQEALLSLERIALKSGDQPLLARVDAQLISATSDASLMALHYTRLGESLEAHGDPSALNFYRAALLAAPLDFAAARGLSRLARAAQDPQLFEEAAEGEARVVQDLAAAAALLLQASQAREARGDAKGAVRALMRALELYPGEEAVATQLTRLMLEVGEVDALLASLASAARSAPEPETSSRLWLQVAGLLSEQKGDIGGAIAALKRVVASAPRNFDALLGLAEFYAKDRQFGEAIARLDEVLRLSPKGPLVLRAQMKKATLLFDHSEDKASARPSVEAVLKAEPKNPQALRLLLLLQVQAGQSEEAKATGETLLAESADVAGRAEVLALLGGIERSRGDADAALHYLEQALALVGPGGPIAAEFKALVKSRKGAEKAVWARYVNALVAYLESRPPLEAASQAFFELGEVLGDQLNQPDQAVAALEGGLRADPMNNVLRRALAMRLKGQRQFDRAITEFRSLLDVDAFDGDTWRQLAECFAGLQRSTEAVLAIAPLALLGVANDLEVASLGARSPRPAGGVPGSLDASVFAALDQYGADAPALQLASTTQETLEKMFPADLARFGVTSKDRLGSRSGHPLRALADRIASVVGAGEFELYLAPQYHGGVAVEFSDPVAIILPASFAELNDAQRAFALGRVLINVARRISIVEKLPPQEVSAFLASAARNVDPNFGRQLGAEEFLNTQARKIHKATSWGKRRALEDAGQKYARQGEVDAAGWLGGVRLAAARGALLLADDLVQALDFLRRTEGDLSGLPPEQAKLGTALVADLLRFWISDTAVSLRQRMGVL